MKTYNYERRITMDYEKKYKNLKAKINNAYLYAQTDSTKAVLEKILPELKESEDKRIRKEIMDFVVGNTISKDGRREKYLAWLEKQGEQKRLGYPYVPGWRENRSDNKPQIKHSVLMLTTHGVVEGEWYGDKWYQYRWNCDVKDTDVLYWLHLSDLESLEKEGNSNSIFSEEQKPANKVEPKFKVGDWIICMGITAQITDLQKHYYIGIDTNGNDFVVSYSNECEIKKWTIKDAKAGDVLCWDDSKCIALFKYIYDKETFKSYGFVGHCSNVYESGPSYHDIEGAHPATKKQCDLLFQKMKEAGYKWDAEKRKIKYV